MHSSSQMQVFVTTTLQQHSQGLFVMLSSPILTRKLLAYLFSFVNYYFFPLSDCDFMKSIKSLFMSPKKRSLTRKRLSRRSDNEIDSSKGPTMFSYKGTYVDLRTLNLQYSEDNLQWARQCLQNIQSEEKLEEYTRCGRKVRFECNCNLSDIYEV